MNTQSFIPLPKRILISFGICWTIAMVLTVIYGLRVKIVGHASLVGLWYLWIIQFAVIRCIVLALLATPLTAWTLRSYAALKWIFLLFMVLVGWTLLAKAVPGGGLIIFGGLLLSFAGLITIRFICRK
jgi:hypothetical protein